MDSNHKPSFDLDAVSSYSWFRVRGEDVVSVLTYRLTFYPLLIVAMCLTGMQLVGSAIECWCPAQTTDAQCNYTKSVCWVSRAYVIDYDHAIPNDGAQKEEVSSRKMTFYPFVPFIILLVACFLNVPMILWNSWQAENGLDLNKMVQSAASSPADENEAEQVAGNLDFRLRYRFQNRTVGYSEAALTWVSAAGVFVLGSVRGTYQTGLFMLTQLLSACAVLLTYPLLNRFLEANFAAWGWGTFRRLLHDEEGAGADAEPSIFQHETLCDFHIRQLQNVHAYTVQCVLPINLWSEKIFLALWLWLPVLLVAGVVNYQSWCRRLLVAGGRRDFVRKHLRIGMPQLAQALNRKDKVTEVFAGHYVDPDTVLALRKLELVAGVQFTSLVVKHLWHEYERRVTLREIGHSQAED